MALPLKSLYRLNCWIGTNANSTRELCAVIESHLSCHPTSVFATIKASAIKEDLSSYNFSKSTSSSTPQSSSFAPKPTATAAKTRSSRSRETSMAFWERGLNLTEEDHKVMIADGQWLNDHHSDAIIILWAKDVCNRPQSTLL